MAERIQRDYNHASEIVGHYNQKYNEIVTATRKDILNNISYLEGLGIRDREIGKREFHIDWGKIGALALGILILL